MCSLRTLDFHPRELIPSRCRVEAHLFFIENVPDVEASQSHVFTVVRGLQVWFLAICSAEVL